MPADRLKIDRAIALPIILVSTTTYNSEAIVCANDRFFALASNWIENGAIAPLIALNLLLSNPVH